MGQERFQAAFDDFLKGSVEQAIIDSTRASWGGPTDFMYVELFDDGTWRTLYSKDVGNLYVSHGLLLQVPTLGSDDWDEDDESNSYFDGAIDQLREAFELVEES